MTAEDIEDRCLQALCASNYIANVDAFCEVGEPGNGLIVVADDGSEFRVTIVRTESERA